jgi:hypothetical protein
MNKNYMWGEGCKEDTIAGYNTGNGVLALYYYLNLINSDNDDDVGIDLDDEGVIQDEC